MTEGLGQAVRKLFDSNPLAYTSDAVHENTSGYQRDLDRIQQMVDLWVAKEWASAILEAGLMAMYGRMRTAWSWLEFDPERYARDAYQFQRQLRAVLDSGNESLPLMIIAPDKDAVAP